MAWSLTHGFQGSPGCPISVLGTILHTFWTDSPAYPAKLTLDHYLTHPATRQ
jgi:hypothetical protein